MPCTYIGPNGQKSILAQQLLDKYQDPSFRDRVLSYIYSEDFKTKFGTETIPLDEVANEPILEWVEKHVVPTLQNTYFENLTPGIYRVFQDTPALAQIGTIQQYSQYLDTIFPDSKVKDIVYRADKRKDLTPKTTIDDYTQIFINGVFYTSNYHYADTYNKEIKGKIYQTILNVSNPVQVDKDEIQYFGRNKDEFIKDFPKNDALIHIEDETYGVQDRYGFVEKEIVVFEPEQIHILGSKQDIEGFEEFIASNVKIVKKEYISKEVLVLPKESKRISRSERPSKEIMQQKLRDAFIAKAKNNPNTLFKVDYTDLANNYANDTGYTTREYAELLEEIKQEIPNNLQFSQEFAGAMANSPYRISKNIEKLIEQYPNDVPINMDGDIIQRQIAQTFIPIINKNGESVGFFDPIKQDEGFQTVLKVIYNNIVKSDNKTPVNKMFNTALRSIQQAVQITKNNPQLSSRYEDIVNSFAFTDNRPSFALLVFDNMDKLGYKISDSNRNKILEDLNKNKQVFAPVSTEHQYNGDEDTIENIFKINYENAAESDIDSSIERDASAGQGAQDWSDVSFELDQRDTASTRIKMMMSAIEEHQYGKYQEAENKQDAIDLSYIKNITEITSGLAIEANNKKIWHDNETLRKEIVDYLKSEFEIIPLQNSLLSNYLVEFDSLFGSALSALAGQSDQSINNYLTLLRSSQNPNLKALANKLDNRVPGKPAGIANLQLQNEFVKVMSKQYNPFLMVSTKFRTDSQGAKYNEVRIYDAQRSSQQQQIIDEWKEGFKLSNMAIVRADGSRTLDTKKAYEQHLPLIQAYNIVLNEMAGLDPQDVEYKQLSAKVNKLLQGQNVNAFISDAYGAREDMKTKFQEIFADYGIQLTDEMAEGLFGRTRRLQRKTDGSAVIDKKTGNPVYEIVDNIEGLTKGNAKFAGDLKSQFKIVDTKGNRIGTPNGMFSAFFMKAAGVNSEQDIDEQDVEAGVEQATLNNPLWTESSTMKALASVVTKFSSGLHSPTHRSAEGKMIWDYSQNTALSKTIQKFKEDFNSEVTKYNQTNLISKDGIRSNGSFYLRYWQANKNNFNKFNLYYLDGLKSGNRETGTTRYKMSDKEQLLTSILAFQNGGKPLGHLFSLTHSDKTMTPLGYNVPKINTGIGNISPDILAEFQAIFHAEHRRIAAQSNIDYNDAKYNIGKNYFFFLPQFNKTSLQARIGQVLYGTNQRITQEMIDTLWFQDGTINPNITGFSKIMTQLILEHIENLTNSSLDYWKQNGISSELLDRKVVQKLIGNLEKPNAENVEEIQKQNDFALKYAAQDYALNHFLWNVNSSMLFFGDPAQVWKPLNRKEFPNATQMDDVDSTMKEYTKRLAKDIAPGQDGAWKTAAKYQTITLKDVEPAQEYITKLGIKNKSNGTDAQELTTLQEHLDVMFAYGQLQNNKYEELSKIIRESRNNDYTFSDEQLDIILQPMKPVYAGFRAPLQGAMLYDYVKSSSYPLIPQFTKGLELDKLRRLMEKNDIARANFESAKKIGLPNVSTKVFTDAGNFIDDVQWKQSVQTLSRDNFRIQQEVPYDETKEAIKIVSQMDKLIVESLSAVNTTFKFPDGREFTSDQLRSFKEGIRMQMLDNELGKLMNKLGSIKVGDSWTSPAKTKIADVLIQEAKDRGYSKNEIATLTYLTKDGDFEIPSYLNAANSKFEAMLMSLFTKVASSKVPGKSYIQASSVGYVRDHVKTIDEVDKTNIVWVGDFDATTALRHQQLVDGKVVSAQVIAPFNFTYIDATGKEVKAKIKDYLNEQGRIDTEKIPIELLQLIGARIPNQGHNSMAAIEIVGFTHESMGDIIIVPSAITGQMGSDFDVDKLFTYKRPYTYKEGKFQTADSNISTDPDLLAKLYFDIHWSVLTHPEMYSKVLNPLDKPDLKNANKEYTVKQSKFSNFYDVVSQLKDFQTGKDAKALVGLTSLSVTFNAVIQNKPLYLGYYALNETGGISKTFTPIKVKYNGEVLELSQLHGTGTNMYQGDVRTKHDNHTTIQSGAVDNVKDRSLDNLNINTVTYPAISALHQLQTEDGKIVNIDFTSAMAIQEVIWDYVAEMKKANDSLTQPNEFIKDLSKTIYDKLFTKYATGLTDAELDTIKDVELSPENFTKQWKSWQNQTNTGKDYKLTQLAVLEFFSKLTIYGERLQQLQKTFNQDTNGAGPSILYALQQMENYEGTHKKHFDDSFFIGEENISDKGQSQQGYFFENIVPNALKVAGTVFPIVAMQSAIQEVQVQTGKQLNELSLKTQQSITRAIKSFAITSTDTFGINPYAQRVRLLNGYKDVPSLAIRVDNLKKAMPENYFLQRLNTNINLLGKGPDFINYQNAKTIRLDDEKNVASFFELLNSSNESIKLVAQDLINYAYLLGAQNTPTSFIRHVPTSYLVATQFAEDMRNLTDTLVAKVKSDVFTGQLFQHNPTIALQISNKFFDPNDTREYPEWFMFPSNTNPELQKNVREGGYVDYVHFKSEKEGKPILYRQKSNGHNVVYQRIDTLGKSDKTEYNASTNSTVRSIFPENRALEEWTPAITASQALTNQVDKAILTNENPDNAYANWGLPKIGNSQDVNRTLGNIMNDRTLPEYLRTVAQVLGSTSQTQQELEAVQALGGKERELKVIVDESTDSLGEYFPMKGELVLKPIGDKQIAAETFLHEIGHQRTSAIVNALGYISERAKTNWTDDVKKQYNDLVDTYRAKHPDILNKVQQLDKIRYQALQEFNKRMAEQGIDTIQMQSDINAQKLITDNHEILYGLSNMQEFLAHVWTNKATMQFLNTIESKSNRTWAEKVWDLITDILQKVGDFIGTTVDKNSLLREAFELTFHLNNIELSERLTDNSLDDRGLPDTMVILNEAKADQVKDLIESSYQQQVEKVNNLSHYLLNISDKRVAYSQEEELSETLVAILDKMKAEIKGLNKLLGSRILTDEDRDRHIRISTLKREIQADIEDMTQQKQLVDLTSLGTKQLQWVDDILKKTTPNVHEVILATTLLSMWRDLDKTIYSGELTSINEKFAEAVNQVRGKASLMHTSLLRYAVNAALLLAKQRGVTLTEEDLGVNLKNPNRGKAMFITLGRDVNPAVQLMTTIIGEAANNKQEEINRHYKRINKLEQLIDAYAGGHKNASKIWDKFIQNVYVDNEDPNADLQVTNEDTWGLVQQFSANWYKFKSDEVNTLKYMVSNINETLERNAPEAMGRKRKAFKSFWENVNSNATVVNIHKLVDLSTGEQKTDGSFEKERSRLIKIVGNEQAVDEAISRAINTFDKYLDEKSVAMQVIDDMVESDLIPDPIELTSEQLGALTEDEQKLELQKIRQELTEKKREDRKLLWIAHNSPVSFIQTSSATVAETKLNHTMKFMPEMIPIAGKRIMYDPMYEEIQKDEKLKEIYNELVAMSNEIRNSLSPGTEEKLHDNYLPVVTQREMSTFFGMMGKLSASKIGQKALEKISVTQTEKDRVHKDEIPIDFIYRNNKNAKELERNLPKIFELAGNMAIHYKNMQPVQQVIETMELLIHNATIDRIEGRQEGKGLERLTEGIRFYKDMLIFKKPKALELVSKNATYSINPKKNIQLQREVSQLSARKVELVDAAIEDGTVDLLRRNSNQIENGEPLTELETIENRLNEIEKDARYVAGSKIGDMLIGINQLKALSFNPFSAVNNFVFGTLSAWLHAYGRVDYDPSDLRWGFSKMRGSIGKALTFNKTAPGDSTKIHNIMDRIGIISEILDTMYGASNLSSEQKSELLKAMHPYAWQKSGDYVHKGAMVLAMMHKQKVEVEINGEKQMIPLYDALDDNGEWNTEKYGERKEWSSNEITEQTAWNKFRDKTRQVALIVHGNQDINAPLLAKRDILWRLIGQFRLSWLGEGINTRFGSRYKDERLGRDVEGRWRTLMALDGLIPFAGYAKSIGKQLLSVITKKDPFAGTTIRHGQELDETDKENMRKNFAGLMMTISVLALIALAKGFGPSEEEKRRRRGKDNVGPNWNRVLLNMLARSYQDLMLYNSPGIMDQITGNLVPAGRVVTDALHAIDAVFNAFFSSDPKAWKKAGKASARTVPFANLYPKFDYMFSRDISSAAR